MDTKGQGTALQFSHMAMNFGPVNAGEVVNASYPFKNYSDGTVRISQIAVSCQCITTEYPQGNIQPGQVDEIKVRFDTKGMFGTHEKMFAVVIEGSQDPIALRLNGKINKME